MVRYRQHQVRAFAVAVYVAAAGLVAGCGAGVEGSGSERAGSARAGVTVTSIHLRPDGARTTRTALWSAAQMEQALAERARLAAGLPPPGASGDVGRVSSAITTDGMCDPRSLWIYSGPIGSQSAMVCYSGSGMAEFDAAWMGQPYQPYALWAGSSPGWLEYDQPLAADPTLVRVNFDVYQRIDPIIAAPHFADSVVFLRLGLDND